MNNRLKTLYPKLADGSISQEGLDWLRLYFETGDPEELLVLLRAELEAADDTTAETSAEQVMFDRIYSGIAAQRFSRGDSPKVIYKLWPRIAVAAAAVAAITLSIWIYTSRNTNTSSSRTEERELYAHDIAPGKNTATLTLSNGKTITLSDAKNGVVVGDDLRYNDNTAVISNEERKLLNSKNKRPLGALEMMLSTPRGGTYQITLSDGTKVWLNAASSLTYNTGLNDRGERSVKLEGEGYFEVAKDKAHPFIVESAGQKVEVLGTHFNINAYKDEGGIKTTLLEGRVNVNGRILKPNEQALNTNGKINIQPADIESDVAWKNGEFMFNDEQLGSIMRKIARWYNVDIVFKNDQVSSQIFSGTITKFGNVSDVLRMLELTGDVNFKVEGRRIIVTK